MTLQMAVLQTKQVTVKCDCVSRYGIVVPMDLATCADLQTILNDGCLENLQSASLRCKERQNVLH